MALYLVKIGNNKYIVKQGTNIYLVSDGQTPTAQYTVTFNSMGGSSVASQTVVSGGTATRPTDPTYSGYSFVGWYENSSYSGSPFDFNTPITADKILYAKWSGSSPTAVTITFASTPYANWNYATQTAYAGDYLQISGFTVTCKNGGSSGATRWTAKLIKLPDTDTFTYTASITTTSRTVNSALTVSCTSSRSINWPTPIDSCDFSDADCPDVDIIDVMNGQMYSYARLTQLPGWNNYIDLYDCFTGNGTWYCAQLVTSGSNPWNYPHCTGLVGFDENLECCDFDSLEGGSGNAYSDGNSDTRYIVIYSAYNDNATDVGYNYGASGSGTPNLINMLNAMASDSDIEHLVMLNLEEEKLYSYK